MMMNSPTWYWFFLVAIAISRLAEVLYSKRLSQKASIRGEKPQKENNFISMVALHSCFFIGIVAEILFFKHPQTSWITAMAAIVFTLAFILRIWTLKTLSSSWNVRIVKPQSIITHGPYQYLRHPNYLVVILEMFTIPILGGAYFSALLFSSWNALVLFFRIPKEEALLFQVPGYKEAFAQKNRLLPTKAKH